MDWPRVIDTPRLQLRDMRAGDAQDVFESYARDPEVLRYLGWLPHQTVEATRQYISHDVHRWQKGSARVWGLTMAGEQPGAGKVFGQIELVPMSFPADEAHHLRLGYLMARGHWGQGLMLEAARAVMNAALFTRTCRASLVMSGCMPCHVTTWTRTSTVMPAPMCVASQAAPAIEAAWSGGRRNR